MVWLPEAAARTFRVHIILRPVVHCRDSTCWHQGGIDQKIDRRGHSQKGPSASEDLGYDDLLPDLKKITSSGSHLLSLINNILDLSKIEAGKMELFITSFEIENMIQTIKDVSEPLAAKNDNGK